MSTLKSRSTSELLVANDDDRNRSSNTSNHLGSGLSISHDSVFNPEHSDENDIRNAQSIQNLALQELIDHFQPQRDSDEDDVGLPYSPCTSPTTAEVLQQGLRETSVKSRSVCSDGSLLSMGSSENDEDSSGILFLCYPHCSSDRRNEQEMDTEEGASFPLSHKAAHHKMSVRPKRTHAIGRHRKLQQLTVASLPATPEDIEESRGNSPDHSWPTIGEGACSSDSISRTSSVMSFSGSTSSLSTGASPTPKKLFSPETTELSNKNYNYQSAIERKKKHKSENVSRRRTVSETPSKEYEQCTKEAAYAEVRSNSLTAAESQQMSKLSMPWAEFEKAKINDDGFKDLVVEPKRRSASPNESFIIRDQSEPIQDASSSSKNEEVNSKHQRESCKASSPSHANVIIDKDTENPCIKSVNSASSLTFPNKDVYVYDRPSENVNIKRDFSYRIAVSTVEEEKVKKREKETTKAKHKNIKEQSTSLFSFSSKSKKVDEFTKDKNKKDQKTKKDDKKELKKDSKEKKEEKGKDIKDKKEEGESPFFSRFWSSRRNSKKKKEKVDQNLDDLQKSNMSTEVVTNESRKLSSSPVSTVDVKAMIQNLTARSNSVNCVAGKNSPKHLPTMKRRTDTGYQKPDSFRRADSVNFSKSMESISGPQSLDSAINITFDAPSNPCKLSGSMPRLNISSRNREANTSMIPSDNVMVIEGEVVRLRKKIFSTEEIKTEKKSPFEKLASSSKGKSGGKIDIPMDSLKHNKRDSDALLHLKSFSSKTCTTEQVVNVQPQKLQKSGLFQKRNDMKIDKHQEPSYSSSKSTASSEGANKAIDNGIAHRLSGFWSSTISNLKSDIFHKEDSGHVQKVDTVKNVSSMPNIEICENIDESKSTFTYEKVPEFLRIQLNKVKSTNKNAGNAVSPPDNPVSHLSAKQSSPKAVTQKEDTENNYFIKSSLETKKSTSGELANVSDSATLKHKYSANELSNSQDQSVSKLSCSPVNRDFGKKTSTSSDNSHFEASVKNTIVTKTCSENESELMKVFHRRSLKIKDKDSSSKPSTKKQSDHEISEKIRADLSLIPAVDKRRSIEGPKQSSCFDNAQSATLETIDRDKCVPTRGMADKRSLSLCQENLPSPRVRTNTSPGITMIASASDLSKCIDKSESEIPEWRKIAQQRREQREQRERQVVTGNGHGDTSLILQPNQKHSGRSKVLDMVSNFQKLQVS